MMQSGAGFGMGSMREMTHSFSKALAEVCGAREVRLRVLWSGGDESLIMSDEVYEPDGSAPFSPAMAGRQIPMHFDAHAASSWNPEWGSRSVVMGAEPAARGVAIDDDCWPFTGRREIEHRGAWRLSVEGCTGRFRFECEVHGFRVIVRVSPSDGALLQGRLERACTLLDLLRSVMESHGPPLLMPAHAGDAGAPSLAPPLLGEAPRIRELRREIRTVALSSIPLLIEGESGTGKEVLARNAHRLGPRRGRPLVILNCLEMPRSLMQSELFGHLKGSFTGASRDRAGLVESACGGTLFLDEIGEMPRALQAALLRVLQEKEVRRIGESRRRSVDVRFVFATNSDLETLVERGRFRRDLFYRMCGVRLRIPPLRERRSDIPMLAEHFLSLSAGERGGESAGERRRESSGERGGGSAGERVGESSGERGGGSAGERRSCVPHITARAMNHLMSHDWPGNVRELKHEMERALALHPGTRHIRPEMLSPRIRERSAACPCHGRETMQLAVRRLEIGMIEDALDRFDGNRTRAAAHLGITRQGLLKKLKRYGMTTHGREE